MSTAPGYCPLRNCVAPSEGAFGLCREHHAEAERREALDKIVELLLADDVPSAVDLVREKGIRLEEVMVHVLVGPGRDVPYTRMNDLAYAILESLFPPRDRCD